MPEGDVSAGERDFGDSAGYGGGGSTRDYRDVLGADADRPRRPNPLDEVMKPGVTGARTLDPRVLARRPTTLLAAIALAGLPLAVAAIAASGRAERRRAELERLGRRREDLARLQA